MATEAARLLLFASCVFADNAAEGGSGGALHAGGGASFEMRDSAFRNNSADGHGAAMQATTRHLPRPAAFSPHLSPSGCRWVQS